jgi:AraC-like DNA-binding protein
MSVFCYYSAMKEPFDFSAARARDFALSAQNPFAFNFGWFKPGAHYQYEMHYGLEFGIILHGTMEIIYPGLKRKLTAGNVWFCGMWEPHGWSVGRIPCEKINLMIWPPALATLRSDETPPFDWLAPFTTPPQRRPQTGGADRQFILELGSKIKERIQKKEKPWEWLRLYVMEAILAVTEQWPGQKKPRPVQIESAGRLNQVLRHFFDRRGKVTTLEAARICGMNRNAFSLMFRHLMGLPFADFVLRYRLNAAASDLRQSDKSVKNIAQFWGFADTSHFDRIFAKYYGCVPHVYRQKSR